ncbi:MAG: hypothetical protein KAU52_01155 [Methanosarcinales archaeon]|nr:hypothetical protein [Methanosarcinales archaeon]
MSGQWIGGAVAPQTAPGRAGYCRGGGEAVAAEMQEAGVYVSRGTRRDFGEPAAI